MKSSTKLFAILVISCLGLVVYSNAFFCSFHFDDGIYIVNNIAIKNIHHLLNIWKFYPTRFVTFLTIALNDRFNGLNVLGYHIFNLAVHIATAVLVWCLTLLTLSTPAMKDPAYDGAGNKITRHAYLVALFVGLIFVCHPIQTEAVTYIWQRTASMAAFFYLASLCFYINSRISINDTRIYYICSLILAIMAMFTKENTVTLPLMILLYEFTFFDGKRNWRHLTPFLLTIFIIPLTLLFTHAEQFKAIQKFVQGPAGTSPIQYLLTQFKVVATYIRLSFLPFNQNIDYDYSISKNFFELPVLFGFLLITTILFWAKSIFSKYKLVSFSIFWFFLTLLPESSFLPLKNVIFEHRLYLPLVGYSMFLVSGAYYLVGAKSLRMMGIILCGIIVCYSVLTYQRNKVWKDEITLWDDAVCKSPNKARPYLNRGIGFYLQGKYNQSLVDLNKGLAIDSHYTEAYTARGMIYENQGKLIKALLEYTKAISIDPTYHTAYESRALIYGKLRHYPEAIADATKLIVLEPNDPRSYLTRGVIFGEQGEYSNAISDFNKSIEVDSNDAEGYMNLGVAFYKLNKLTQSISEFNKALELDPGYKEAYNYRAFVYYQLKN